MEMKLSRNRLHAESVLECGGKRSATTLSNCLRSSLHTKAPSPLRSAGALQRLVAVSPVHCADARPILEVEDEPQRAAGILPAEGASLPTRRRRHVAGRKVSLCEVHGANASSKKDGGFS